MISRPSTVLLLAPLLLAARVAHADGPPADGWTGPIAAPKEETCAVDSPRVALRQAVLTLQRHPDAYPRPTIACGKVAVPLSSNTRLLEKVQQPETVLAWTPRLTPWRRGTALVVDVDVPPIRAEVPPRDPSVPQPLDLDPPVRIYEPPHWRTDPSRLPGGPTSATQPSLPRPRPQVACVAVEAIEKDGRYLHSSGGWATVSMVSKENPPNWYRLGPTEVFGAAGRLFVAPIPRHPRGSLEIFEIDPATATATSLGSPAPPAASWRQEVSDLRERDGALEALVIERDPSDKGKATESNWAALMRQTAGGWSRLATFVLPPSAATGCIRFDGADAKRVILVTDGAAWSQPAP